MSTTQDVERITNALAIAVKQLGAVEEARAVADADAFEAQNDLARTQATQATVKHSADADIAKLKDRITALAALYSAPTADTDDRDELLKAIVLETKIEIPDEVGPPTIAEPASLSSTGILQKKRRRETVDSEMGSSTLASTAPAKKRKTGPSKKDVEVEVDGTKLLKEIDDYQFFHYATTIVKSSKKRWVELRCPDCQGSYSPNFGRFLRGAVDFQTHLKMSHKYPNGTSWDKAIELCEHREMSTEDMITMAEKGEAGGPHVEKVELQNDSFQSFAAPTGNAKVKRDGKKKKGSVSGAAMRKSMADARAPPRTKKRGSKSATFLIDHDGNEDEDEDDMDIDEGVVRLAKPAEPDEETEEGLAGGGMEDSENDGSK